MGGDRPLGETARIRSLVVRVFLAHAASVRHAILFARMKFRGFLHSFFMRVRVLTLFFARLVSTRPFTPPSQPFNHRFRPFLRNDLTKRYRHAILPASPRLKACA